MVKAGYLQIPIQSLREPEEIIDAGFKLVRSAKYEILIIFHTANALVRQDKAGGVDLLVENVVKYNTRVKILVPIEDAVKDIIQRLEQIKGFRLKISNKRCRQELPF